MFMPGLGVLQWSCVSRSRKCPLLIWLDVHPSTWSVYTRNVECSGLGWILLGEEQYVHMWGWFGGGSLMGGGTRKLFCETIGRESYLAKP